MRLAHAAQELAFDAIWVSDHVFIPYEYEPNYPYSTTGRPAPIRGTAQQMIDTIKRYEDAGGSIWCWAFAAVTRRQ